jgi:hypothetical protein
MSAHRPTSPRVTRPFLTARNYIGTVNPAALKQPLLQKKNLRQTYDDLAELSAELDAAKQDYGRQAEQLGQMLTGAKLTAFCQFKKWLTDFSKRIKTREAELGTFSQYMDSYRKEAHPTFVEVDAAGHRPPRFDAVTASLLVSNPERSFFGKDDIQEQNKALANLIDQQTQALLLLNARLALFTKFQHENVVETVRSTLEKGQIPRLLAGAAPTRALELRTKRKLLSAELAVLVDVRRKLLLEKLKKKMKLRRYRLKVKMAVKIQRIVRGFLARQAVKKSKAAAVKIQRVWRGYSVRFRFKQVFEEMNGSLGLDSPTSERRMKRVVKTRVNPDGREQEYYDYDYYDEVSDNEVHSAIDSLAGEEIEADQAEPEQLRPGDETAQTRPDSN